LPKTSLAISASILNGINNNGRSNNDSVGRLKRPRDHTTNMACRLLARAKIELSPRASVELVGGVGIGRAAATIGRSERIPKRMAISSLSVQTGRKEEASNLQLISQVQASLAKKN